jgi:hypothetical protein
MAVLGVFTCEIGGVFGVFGTAVSRRVEWWWNHALGLGIGGAVVVLISGMVGRLGARREPLPAAVALAPDPIFTAIAYTLYRWKEELRALRTVLIAPCHCRNCARTLRSKNCNSNHSPREQKKKKKKKKKTAKYNARQSNNNKSEQLPGPRPPSARHIAALSRPLTAPKQSQMGLGVGAFLIQ